MRKYLYLITEHEHEDRVGCASILDQPLSRPEKNQEGPLTVFDRDAEDYRDVGKQVGLGYADFDSEEDYNERISAVLKRKLGEVDAEWLEKAGLEPKEVLVA